MVFPFLPSFARGLGVPVASLQRSLSIRSVAGFIVPLLVPLSERFGRKKFLFVGMLTFSAGCFLAWQSRGLLLFTVAILVIALGKAFYDPIMRAHLGDIVPYNERGKAIAVTEFAWSGAFLIGAPIVSLMIAYFGWNSPFALLAILGICAVGVIWRYIPETGSAKVSQLRIGQIVRAVSSNPPLLGATIFVFLLMFANILIFSSYAAWMETQFQVNVGGLGVTAMVIGSAELVGEILVGLISDRFGKRRLVLLATAASAGSNFLLPQTDSSLVMALVVLFAVFITFEMAFVCVIPIFTELMPEARSVPLAILSFTPPVTRAIGLWLVGSLTTWGGFSLLGAVAGLASLLAVVIFFRWVRV